MPRCFILLAENSLDLIARYDLSGQTLFVSPSVKRVLGYTPEEALGANPLEAVHPEDLPSLMDVRAQLLLEPARAITSIYRRLHSTGHYIWVENTSSAICDENGEVFEFHVVMRDVTERKIAEEKLQKAEAHYRSIFENAVEGFFSPRPKAATSMPTLPWRAFTAMIRPKNYKANVDISGQLYIDPAAAAISCRNGRKRCGFQF